MPLFVKGQSFLRNLFLSRRAEVDLDEEVHSHLEMLTEENIRAGMPPKEAQRAARIELGGIEHLKEQVREERIGNWVHSVISDCRYGFRQLRKNPGFTAVAVTALALGIGADTAMYTIVNGLRSWDVGLDNRDQIVVVTATNTTHSRGWGASYPDFRDFRSQTKSLAGLAAYQFAPVNLSDRSGLPERYYCVQMSANGFSVVGQKPLLGRNFITEDERPGAPAVLIIGYHVWRDRYAQDPAIIGKTVHLDEIPRVVIGVMPPGRRFPEETDLWTPLITDAAREKRDNRNLTLFGRLGDDVSLASARAELSAMARRLAQQYPNTNKDITADVRPIIEIYGAYFMRPLFLALFGAVGFVLLIACADVANMLLSRAAERSREISIRVAIGAGRIPIIRQLLLESVVLSIAGGLFGWLVALGGLRWFDSGLGTLEKPVWLHLSLDRSALFYLAAISVGTGILFGLAPALRLARTDVNAALKEGSGYGVVGSKFGLRVSNVLVAFQMALCVVLLAGAGLMIRSAVNLYSAPVGVNTARVLTMRVNLPEAKYAKPESWIAFHEELNKRLKALPGVELASVASHLPLGGWIPFSFEFEGRSKDAAQSPEAGGLVVSNNYFQTMQVQPHRGRLFLDADGVAGPPVVVVNESFAAKFWPGEDALGKHTRVMEERLAGPWLTVVGVVPDILQNFRQNLQHDPLIYLPFAKKPQRQIFLVARTGVPSETLADAFRREVQRVDENLAVYDVRTLENRIAESRLTVTLFGAICSIFAGVATMLAAIGLYGVIAHAVSQRRQEIGLRMAIGATRRDIVRLVLAQGIRPLVPGLAIGLLLALTVTRLLRVALVGVSPSDPLTFVGIVFVLMFAAGLGCLIPARRATRVDPMIALRYE
ncbi:MAG TPA: ABC transporter permease [Candidatus Dormibacteraeota bacterium]|nr:ABC transporter permease [Candidatus Dormibacteraeota bacterium]